MDVFVAFLFFTVALLIAGYYVWSVPQQQASDSLSIRLREMRTQSRSGARAPSDLIQREHRGSLAFLGDFIAREHFDFVKFEKTDGSTLPSTL